MVVSKERDTQLSRALHQTEPNQLLSLQSTLLKNETPINQAYLKQAIILPIQSSAPIYRQRLNSGKVSDHPCRCPKVRGIMGSESHYPKKEIAAFLKRRDSSLYASISNMRSGEMLQPRNTLFHLQGPSLFTHPLWEALEGIRQGLQKRAVTEVIRCGDQCPQSV
jgi:hypothetical protein